MGLVTILVLVVASPVGAFPFLAQTTPEPSPRPTATPAPYLELFPTQGVAGNATDVTAAGAQWPIGTVVTLYWDDASGGPKLGEATVNGEGRFQIGFKTPTDATWAGVGAHTVIAVQDGSQATAGFELIAPTPTYTPLPPTPTFTHTPVTPSATPTTTNTPIPSATLRPVTPMVTISPIPPTRAPAVTRAPTATRTNTPLPGPPTQTLTPSSTPLPTQTPGPGTPSATPLATPTPVEEISDTGGGWGTVFVWGFVLGGLLLVFRMLRVRSLTG